MALLQYQPGMPAPRLAAPVKSMASIVAILCAIGSFFVSPGLGLLLAIVAVVAGLIGMMRAIHPQVSGGILSIVAILLAALGFIAAILKAIF